MKVLVLSDSHRSLRPMVEAVEREQPQQILHLGDLAGDTGELKYAYRDIPLAAVPGNCDPWTGEPEEKLLRLGGHLVLMGHGHQWQVKHSLDRALAAARRAGAEVLLFGHTHRPLCYQERDGLWVLNPGSIRDSESYGLLLLEPDRPVGCRLAALTEENGV